MPLKATLLKSMLRKATLVNAIRRVYSLQADKTCSISIAFDHLLRPAYELNVHPIEQSLLLELYVSMYTYIGLLI